MKVSEMFANLILRTIDENKNEIEKSGLENEKTQMVLFTSILKQVKFFLTSFHIQDKEFNLEPVVDKIRSGMSLEEAAIVLLRDIRKCNQMPIDASTNTILGKLSEFITGETMAIVEEDYNLDYCKDKTKYNDTFDRVYENTFRKIEATANTFCWENRPIPKED